MSVSIAIIKPNQVGFSIEKKDKQNETNEYLTDTVEDYIEIRKEDINQSEKLMDIIVTTLKLDDDIGGNTMTVHEEPGFFYQMCFVSLYDEEPGNSEISNINKNIRKLKQNKIANTLADNTHSVFGSVVLMKTKIEEDLTTCNVNITLNDVVNVLYNKFIHTGLIVNTRGEIQEKTYINPIELFLNIEKEKIGYYEYEILNKVLMLFVIKNGESELNEIGSKITHLSGNPEYFKDVYGTVFITLRNKIEDIRFSEHTYINIEKKDLEKMLSFYNTEILSESVNIEESINTASKNGKRTHINFYRILETLCDKHNLQFHENTQYQKRECRLN